jgi:hypothetical protein
VRRRGAGRGRTWEGAERSGVGAQGPVAHPRHELQAEDLLQESRRPLAAATPLALHPAAIHRREMREGRPKCCTKASLPAPPPASASPSAEALFFLPPQRRCQVIVRPSNHRASQMVGAGRESFPPLTLRTALQARAPSRGIRPLLDKPVFCTALGCTLLCSATSKKAGQLHTPHQTRSVD